MDKIQFDAVPFSIEQVEQKFINELASGNGGVIRRIAAGFLGKSSDYYYDLNMDEETGEALLGSVESLAAYVDLLKIHIEMMESAQARIFTVLSYHFEDAECDL